MPVITNIADLQDLARRRVPRMFYDYADSGSWTEGTYRANESDFAKLLLRQRVAVNMENRSTRTTMIGTDGRDAGGDRADRPDRHAARRRRDPGRARGREVRHPVHAVDDEHLLDRGHRRQHQPAVLVPALLDARPRLHGPADGPRQVGRLLGAGADARPAGARPAPQGPEERPDRAAQADAGQHPEPDDQAALVPGHGRHASAHASATWSATPRA